MICKKQSYLISKYLFFPLQVALGVSTSFLWEYVINTKPGEALEWNSLGNIFCTNIHPQMAPPPSGPVSPHYITWLVFHDPANIFLVTSLKMSPFSLQARVHEVSEPSPANFLLWLSKIPCQATTAGRQPRVWLLAVSFEVDKICTHGHLSVISCTHSFVLLYCQRILWMMSLFSEENRPSELFTDIINYL